MRLAIYFNPPADDPLTAAAANWLGRDAFTGLGIAQPEVDGFPAAELRALTADPRRYGFHATLKPPFHLAEGRTLDEVGEALVAFCTGRGRFHIPALALTQIGPFFALTEDSWVTGLQALADAAVLAFDSFRAPPSGPDIARRQPDKLTPRQRDYLDRCGYPYVFEEFRFHMSLTGQVPEARRDATEAALRRHFARFIGQPLAIDAVALFVEPATSGDFVVERRIPFSAPTDSA